MEFRKFKRCAAAKPMKDVGALAILPFTTTGTSRAPDGPVSARWYRNYLVQISLKKKEDDLLLEQEEVAARKEARGNVTRWKTKQGILRIKGAAPSGDCARNKEHEELLRDV